MRRAARIDGLKKAVNGAGGTRVGVGGIRSKEHQPAAGDIDPEGVDRRHSVASSQINDQFAMHTRQPRATSTQRRRASLVGKKGRHAIAAVALYCDGECGRVVSDLRERGPHPRRPLEPSILSALFCTVSVARSTVEITFALRKDCCRRRRAADCSRCLVASSCRNSGRARQKKSVLLPRVIELPEKCPL